MRRLCTMYLVSYSILLWEKKKISECPTYATNATREWTGPIVFLIAFNRWPMSDTCFCKSCRFEYGWKAQKRVVLVGFNGTTRKRWTFVERWNGHWWRCSDLRCYGERQRTAFKRDAEKLKTFLLTVFSVRLGYPSRLIGFLLYSSIRVIFYRRTSSEKSDPFHLTFSYTF